MKRLTWLLGTMAATLPLAALGCGGDSFTPGTGGGAGTTATTGGSGGSGGETTTGGAGGATGGAGGATTGGTGGAGGATGGTGGAGGAIMCQPISDPCAECAYATCEELYCACYAEVDCAALVNCLAPCDPTDQACQQPCLTAHKDSISKAFLLGDCASGSCSGSCMGVAAIPECPKCLFTQCPAQMNECFADPECNEIVNCAGNCSPGDFACAVACTEGKSQTAIDKAFAVQGCAGSAQKCGPSCGQ